MRAGDAYKGKDERVGVGDGNAGVREEETESGRKTMAARGADRWDQLVAATARARLGLASERKWAKRLG